MHISSTPPIDWAAHPGAQRRAERTDAGAAGNLRSDRAAAARPEHPHADPIGTSAGDGVAGEPVDKMQAHIDKMHTRLEHLGERIAQRLGIDAAEVDPAGAFIEALQTDALSPGAVRRTFHEIVTMYKEAARNGELPAVEIGAGDEPVDPVVGDPDPVVGDPAPMGGDGEGAVVTPPEVELPVVPAETPDSVLDLLDVHLLGAPDGEA